MILQILTGEKYMDTQSRNMKFKKPLWLIISLAILALFLAACQSTAAPTSTKAPLALPPTSTTAPVASPTVAAIQEAAINVAMDPKLGSILVDGKGMTLYLFTKDEADKSNCNADCLAKWPPLLTQGSPVLGEGVDASLVGSAKLADGSMIVTYNHMPLYYWVKDLKPGDTTGQDVGGVWYVVSPKGEKVEIAEEASPTSTPAAAAFVEPTINGALDPKLGSILVDGKGMTLYMFTKDETNKSNCNADCLAKWPPLLTQGSPILGAGVDDSKIGSAMLADGTKIVTYNGMPLYYWVNDMKPGDTTGEGVGSVWYVVSPDGKKVEEPGDDKGTETPVAAAAAAAGEVTLNVYTDPKLGSILVDGKGMTLYMYTVDGPNQSNCTGDCLVKWPPFLTQGNPVLGAGVDDSKIGTAKLADGTLIVTYNGMPLYYWFKDTKPGDTLGQGVGSVWYVVDPDGDPVGR
jgi:predicted lipoprotein with Yx(FWY)xxD motif